MKLLFTFINCPDNIITGNMDTDGRYRFRILCQRFLGTVATGNDRIILIYLNIRHLLRPKCLNIRFNLLSLRMIRQYFLHQFHQFRIWNNK